jgi:fructokinase
VNLRQDWYQAGWIERSLNAADIVKLNRDEADLLAIVLGLDGSDDIAFARSALRTFCLELVCITRAEEGCLLVSPTETVDVGGKQVDVADAVGAGDAFTAALIAACLNDWPLEPAGRFANDVGGLVASRPGAMPDLSDELTRLREQHAPR